MRFNFWKSSKFVVQIGIPRFLTQACISASNASFFFCLLMCRPLQLVLGILPQSQRGDFAREDGALVINENAERDEHG